MYDDGYTDMTSIDISDVLIDTMQKNAKEKEKTLIYEVMDATKMTY